jgi:HD superfamily phosphohydrolase
MVKIEIIDFVNYAIHGIVGLTSIEKELIQTKEMRRLKGIKQLSFGQVKYPSATHTRYSHSIGTLAVTTKYLNWLIINARSYRDVISSNLQIMRIAALLHDVGHSAFSHSIEQAINENTLWYGSKVDHEDFTKEIILGKSEVNKVLMKSFNKKDINKIAAIATGNYYEIEPDIKFLVDILTGDFGSDRVDYLLRDSHHAGLSYGKIEFEQLVSKLCINNVGDENRLCIKYDESRVGLYAATALELARYYHFSSLVFQPEIRCLNLLLKSIIEKYVQEIKGDKITEIRNFFLEYDDSILLSKVESFQFKDGKKVKALLDDIKDYSCANFDFRYEHIDELLPTLGFMLYLIKQDSDTFKKFRSEIEDEVRKQYRIKDNQTLIFDLQINGKSGLPVEMYKDTDNSKSVLLQDKSPLLERLSQSLVSLGSVAIYSSMRLKGKINFNELLYQRAIKYVNLARKNKKVFSEEYLLRSINKIMIIAEEIELYKTCATDFKGIVPSLSRLNDLILKDVNNPYKDFRQKPFTYSKKLYRDLMVLAGFSLINIIFKPVAMGKDGPIGNPEEHIKFINSIVRRYDFYVTSKGLKYLNIINKPGV